MDTLYIGYIESLGVQGAPHSHVSSGRGTLLPLPGGAVWSEGKGLGRRSGGGAQGAPPAEGKRTNGVRTTVRSLARAEEHAGGHKVGSLSAERTPLSRWPEGTR